MAAVCAGFYTISPAVELIFQPGNGVAERLVLLFLPLIFFLPLFRCQLHVHSHCVLNGLCPNDRAHTHTDTLSPPNVFHPSNGQRV